MTRPAQTIFVLITDLYEGGDGRQMVRRMAELVSAGGTAVCLLALSDDKSPRYHEPLAAELTALGAPSFACTPDLFPGLMAAAIGRQDVAVWAAREGVVLRGRPGDARAR